MRDIPAVTTERKLPMPLRACKKCLILLVLGAVMGGMLVAGLCTRRKREA